jgi:hypothetical protein
MLYVRHAESFHFHVPGLVWEAGQLGEALLRRSQDRALGPTLFKSRELGDLLDVSWIQALGDFGYPHREGKQVRVDLVLWWSRLVAIPMAVDRRHGGAAAAGIHQLQAVKMIVSGAPIDPACAHARSTLDRLGHIRAHVQFLFPKQRIGA